MTSRRRLNRFDRLAANAYVKADGSSDRRHPVKHHLELHNLSGFIPLDRRGETRSRLKLLPTRRSLKFQVT